MLAALSASRDRQRQLVADAGHELRTPLTSLRTNLDLLTQADRQGGLSEAMRGELLDDVRFQIEELTTLIGDLTELAREQPAQVLLEQVDLAEIVERAVERVRRRASSLRFDLRVSPWWVTGEAAALERAVTNLLDNAAKWSPPLGTVTVRIDRGPAAGQPTRATGSPRRICRTSSTGSTAPRSRGPCPARGWGCRSCARSPSGTAGRCRSAGRTVGGAVFEMWVPGRTEPSSPGPRTARARAGPRALSVAVKQPGQTRPYE